MSQIPGVNVTDNVNKPKSPWAQKTTWALALAGIVKLAGTFVPWVRDNVTDEGVNALATVFALIAGFFARQSIEATKVTAVTGVIKK